jgi:hypothetical protein
MSTVLDVAAPPVTRPSALRRVAVGLTGFLAGALPLMWGTGSLVELLTGQESEHRFHQLTGQGVLLAVLWLYGVGRLVVAGWRGRRPAPSAALAHLTFVAATLVTVAFVPGQGVVAVALIVAVTGALLWLALPQRPRLRLRAALDPLLTPVALLGAALYTPFVLSERTLQATSHDEHAEMTHYFDMAWVCVVLVAVSVIAALFPAARRLGLLAGLGTVVVGATRLAFVGEPAWSLAAVTLGVVGSAIALLRVPGGEAPESHVADDLRL